MPSTVSSRAQKPKIIESSQEWDGTDGLWSSFIIRLPGDTVDQQFRLLPSTSLSQTLVISSKACDVTWANLAFKGGYNCERSRGNLYQTTQKLKEKNMVGKVYGTKLDQYYIFRGYGLLGINATFWADDLSFGYKADDSIVANNVTIGMLADPKFSWMGLLGLDAQEVSHKEPPLPTTQPRYSVRTKSTLETLRDVSIPSLSWAYHAGSKSREAPGSLILGGYDRNLFVPTNREFSFHHDVEKSISTRITPPRFRSANASMDLALQPGEESIVARIDSTRPYIYLPRVTFLQLSTRLGAVWDPISQHHLINATMNEQNLANDIHLEFDLWSWVSDPVISDNDKKTTISLPYKSLVQELRFPYMPANSTSLYLPVMPSDDVDQYVLGRVFLQEAYLIANYERKHFAIFPISWNKKLAMRESQVMPIGPDSEQSLPTYLVTDKGLQTSTNLTAAAKALIGVGVTLFVGLCFLFFFLIKRHRLKKRRLAKAQQEEQLRLDSTSGSGTSSSPSNLVALNSAASASNHEEKLYEAGGTPVELVELESKSLVELPDTRGAMAMHYKDAELDANPREEIFEMEGTPVTGGAKIYEKGRLVQGQGPVNSSEIAPLVEPTGLRPPPRNDVPASPIPKTPAEYYGRKIPRKFVFSKADLQRYQGLDSMVATSSDDDRPPASAIPQTPIEYYGRNVPQYRRAVKTVEKIEETDSESTVSSPESGTGTGDHGQQIPSTSINDGRSVSPPDTAPQTKTTNLEPASPIPQTPLEFYGELPAISSSSEKRKWVGRAPEAPLVILIPATPIDGSAPPLPLRSAARERRPPGAWETDSDSEKTSSAGSSPEVPQR